MKRLIFLISLLMAGQVSANTKTVVISDTVYFNFTYTSAIDSAQLILQRGTVNDTLSLMPITGSSHKICEWGPAIFNLVDSAGTYQVWIESYSSGAIIDTVLGDCLVELAALTVNEIATYPEYVYKMVVSGSPTTITFDVSYIDPSPSTEANDFCLGMLVRSQDGNSNRYAVNIANFTIADSNFIVRPGFQSAPNVGDTMFILPTRGGVEPSVWTQFELDITGGGNAGIDLDNTVGDFAAGDFEAGVLIDGNDVWNASNSIIATKGDVDSTVAGTKWLISHALTQGNYYWNDNMILFFTGTAVGQVARIVDFMAANDSVTFTPALTVAPTVGDSFMILGILSENAPDVNVASADVDALDGVDFTEAYWAELADRADSGAAGGTGLDSATTSRIIGRKTWGIAAGSGDDSSTIAQRGVGWVDTTDYALNVPGAGTGVNVCSVGVYDTGNSVMVSGIMVQAENSSGANQGRNRTNVSGISVLNLNDGDYNLRIPMNSGYIQTTNPQPFTVSGATNDTINVTRFSPTAPAGDLCKVWGFVKDANQVGVPKADVSAIILQEFWPIRYGQVAIVARHSVKSDSVGYYELPIYPSTILLTADGDSSSYYMIKATKGAQQIFQYKVTVPDSSTFEMVPDSD